MKELNLKFEYLYRDSGNFKNWGEITFSNPNRVNPLEAMKMAESVLIDRMYFYANKAKLPDLHFADYDEDLDHGWHEASGFEFTAEETNDAKKRSIEEFIEDLHLATVI